MKAATRYYLIIILQCLVARTAAGQNKPTVLNFDIGAKATCIKCSIVTERVTTLDKDAVDGWVGEIAIDDRGVIYVDDRNSIKVFGTDGRFVRKIGRAGKGPGEYVMIRNLLVSKGKLHVLDGILGRHSIFDVNGKFLESTSFPNRAGNGRSQSAVLFDNGDLMMNSSMVAPTDAGFTVQRVDKTGKRIVLIEEGRWDLHLQHLASRLILAQKSGAILIASPWSFTINHYSPSLTLTASTSLRAEWLKQIADGVEPSDGTLDVPPTTMMDGMWEDKDGLVWLHFLVPSKDWKPGPSLAEAKKMKASIVAPWRTRPRYDNQVVVVDLKRNSVVASTRFPFVPGGPFGVGYFTTYKEDSEGSEVSIYRMSLKR